MNIIEKTLEYYPTMAYAGWCYSGNCSIAGKSEYCLDLNDPVAVKKYIIEKIEFYDHMGADACLIGFGSYKAYWENGHHDPKMVPTFIRVTNPRFLEELHFCSRNSEIDKHGYSFSLEVTRFDLIDIE